MIKTISVVMPCLNEKDTIGVCVKNARKSLELNGLTGEVVVADNGSTDGSRQIALENGATIVDVKERGYGSAYLAGLSAATGDYIIIADSDDTYDFFEIPKFVKKLNDGYEFVNGNRFGNLWSLRALPVLHRYFGAIILSSFLNFFFWTGLTDAHCGMRGLTREALGKMELKCKGMEFASEMLIKSKKAKLKTTEVEIKYNPRSEGSKLNPIRDGIRHVKTILKFYFNRIN